MNTGCSDPYPCILDPIVRYLEVTEDPEVLEFAEAFADGMIAGVQKSNVGNGDNRIRDDGSFGGYNCHLHMSAVLGVARLGQLTGNTRYLEWSRKVYDWLMSQGTDWGWFPESPGERRIARPAPPATWPTSRRAWPKQATPGTGTTWSVSSATIAARRSSS